MKKYLTTIFILLFTYSAFSSQDNLRSKDYFLQKSKEQKTAGWILLGSGAAIPATGGIIQLNQENKRVGGFDFDFTGAKIAIVDGAVCLSSIPFFIASSINKNKGMNLLYKIENTQQIQKSSLFTGPFLNIRSMFLKKNILVLSAFMINTVYLMAQGKIKEDYLWLAKRVKGNL